MVLLWNRALRIVGLALFLFGQPGDASVRIVDSGKEYRSWPDQDLGPTLAVGEIYKARLQQLRGNSHLCSDSPAQNWNVTVPEDGLPGTYFCFRWNGAV